MYGQAGMQAGQQGMGAMQAPVLAAQQAGQQAALQQAAVQQAAVQQAAVQQAAVAAVQQAGVPGQQAGMQIPQVIHIGGACGGDRSKKRKCVVFDLEAHMPADPVKSGP